MYSFENSNLLIKQSTLIVITIGEFLFFVGLIYIISVTFGASLLDDFSKTLFFSVLSCLICVMPSLILIEHQNALDLLHRILIKKEYNNRFEYKCAFIAQGFIIGAWFGALVIPLDWDRWWQEWPTSSSLAGIFGSILGFIISNFNYKNKNKLHL